MIEFNAVLDNAKKLSTDDQLRLIDALWEIVPADANLPLHPDWGPELERRLAAIEAGQVTTIDWTTIRDEALGRLAHGTVH